MKQKSKLSSEQQGLQQGNAQQTGARTGRDFASVEELIRFDAMQTSVPPAVDRRLAESSAGIPAPRRSWWRRLFR